MVTSYRRKHKRERNQVRGWKSGYCVSILEQQAFVVSELVLVRKPVCLGPRDQRLPRCSQESSGTTGIASLAQAGFSSKLSHAVPGRTWLLWGSWRGAQSLWLVGSSPPPVPCHLGLSIRQRPAWQLLSINSSEGVSKTEDRVSSRILDVTAPQLGHVLLNESFLPASPQGEGFHKSLKEAGRHRGPVPKLLATGLHV